MTLVEQYEARLGQPGSIVPFLKIVAAELDSLIRNATHAGIGALPAAVLPGDVKTWETAMNAVNGQGDVLNRLKAMCAAIDAMQMVILHPMRMVEQGEAQAARKAAIVERMAKARAARGRTA